MLCSAHSTWSRLRSGVDDAFEEDSRVQPPPNSTFPQSEAARGGYLSRQHVATQSCIWCQEEVDHAGCKIASDLGVGTAGSGCARPVNLGFDAGVSLGSELEGAPHSQRSALSSSQT